MKALMMLLSFLMLPLFCFAEVEQKTSYVMCRNDKAVRTIRVDLTGAICRTFYTKEGKEEVVARSGTSAKCTEVAEQIRSNLEKSVWKCKEVAPDRVSFTLE